MRRYGYIPAPNAPANTPAVIDTSGLGTGGGAGVQTPDSGNFGEIIVDIGSAPGAGGYVTIAFPDTPPALFISGSEGLGALTQETDTNNVTISWEGTAPALTRQFIHYEWADPLKAN